MIYNVIGLMSGSSLDGLDVAYVKLEEVRGKWSYEILEAECIGYSAEWTTRLAGAAQLNALDFAKLDAAYGSYTGEVVARFIEAHGLEHKVHFIASHGHTVFHEPLDRMTVQMGDGAAIAAETGLPVINNLRSVDVALGGQGAPIVPMGDKLLFADYEYLLNIGGIANLTIRRGEAYEAFDVCPANQLLNRLAAAEGLDMDKDGRLASSGVLHGNLLEQINKSAYYLSRPPKSLSNKEAMNIAAPFFSTAGISTADLLHTATAHIAAQIAAALKQYGNQTVEPARMLVTGGGALNIALVDMIEQAIAAEKIALVIPDVKVMQYKEALVMALLGTLRWREEVSVLSSVTGASRDSVGGALWLT